MRSLMRHISNPGDASDAVDQLDAVVCPEIADLVRAAVDPDHEKHRSAWRALDARGMFVDALSGRTDASHTLTTPRAVFVLQLR